mmetsp:Transcript_96662/g.207422  ORF Transcript_96662/g.207422 Transcript_96662/m.207422 type:complete len:208 (+) Transcript_96662:853-1476(+)
MLDSTIWVPIDIVLLICIPACFKRIWSDMLPVIATVDYTDCGLPVATAFETPSIVAVPMVADPPTIDIVDIRAVAVPIEVMSSICLVAGCEVAVGEAAATHARHAMARLVKYPAEPALAAASHWAIHVRGQSALGSTGRRERRRALSRHWQHGLVGIASIVWHGAVIHPRWASVIVALLVWPIGEPTFCGGDEAQCNDHCMQHHSAS